MSEWKEYYLSELGTLSRGKSKHRPRWAEHLYGGKYPFIQTGEITAANKYIDKYSQTYSDAGLAQSKLWKKGTLCITIAANIAEIAILKFPACFPDSVLGFIPDKEKANLDFTFYILKHFQSRLKKLAIGSVQDNINVGTFLNIKFSFPSIEEQKQIADVLSCLDAKIENLRRQNETLEQIAQTLFKHWFIDFEFPNADGKPYKSSGGAMSPSELGDIPEGWRVGKLGDYLSVKHGYAFKGEYITIEETKKILLTPGNFKIGGGFNDSKYKYYSDDDYSDEYILRKKDLTVTMTDLSKEGDTLGYPAFIPEVKDKVFLHNQRIGKIENNKIDKTFLYFLLCRREYRFHILGTSSGSTVRHTSPSRIYDFNFMIPDFELVDKFSTVATSTIDKILINCEQIQTLTKTRDTLLPKLMSGQLRVKE